MTSRTTLGVLTVLGAAVLLAACAADPVLVDGDEVPGVTSTTQNQGSTAPGWTWCDGIGPHLYASGSPVSTWLAFGAQGDAGAVLVDRTEDGLTSDRVLGQIEEQADLCAASDAVDRGYDIEPLTGLGADEVGWRTRTTDGEQGEYVVVRLDDARLLAVGVESVEDTLPVDLADLVALARDGAERFPARTG